MIYNKKLQDDPIVKDFHPDYLIKAITDLKIETGILLSEIGDLIRHNSEETQSLLPTVEINKVNFIFSRQTPEQTRLSPSQSSDSVISYQQSRR